VALVVSRVEVDTVPAGGEPDLGSQNIVTEVVFGRKPRSVVDIGSRSTVLKTGVTDRLVVDEGAVVVSASGGARKHAKTVGEWYSSGRGEVVDDGPFAGYHLKLLRGLVLPVELWVPVVAVVHLLKGAGRAAAIESLLEDLQRSARLLSSTEATSTEHLVNVCGHSTRIDDRISSTGIHWATTAGQTPEPTEGVRLAL